MSQGFQAAALVALPRYPNAAAWSDENLVAVASDHLVTILNPAALLGARGLIKLTSSKPFPIGVIKREELLSPCLLPNCLSREVLPCVRSISWSPIGFAPNAGCLLAVCTTEGRVKLYRMPFCEYSAEWIEVMDVSERLYTYLASVSFEVSGNSEEIETMPNCGGNPQPLITVECYASRSAMLSSLIVVWSPIIKLTARMKESCPSDLSLGFSVLAVGGKSGTISFWRSFEQESYSTIDGGVSVTVSLIGFLQAHDSWVTAASWALFDLDASNPKLLLATGSSNGCVKIWLAYGRDLMKASENSHVPFSLLKEVVSVDSSTISVLSLVVPEKSMGKILLAFGKGSGTIEVWIYDLLNSKFETAGYSDAHQHIVTGLAWAFGGKCLYSCSQDERFVRAWITHESSLSEVPIPPNTPGVKSSFDVPNVYDLCLGLAVSPGNLAIAVVHSFDTGLLDPMYQERTQKAAVEFLWTGGQQLDLVFNRCPDFYTKSFPGLPEKELISWETNIFWSINQYQNVDKPMVLWDIIAALSAFKQSTPDYVVHILLRWMRAFLGMQFDVSLSGFSKLSKLLANITSRQLHILNIVCRQVVLKRPRTNQINGKGQEFEGFSGAVDEESLWLKLLLDGEKELRERLLYVHLSTVLQLASYRSMDLGKCCWTPIGLGQMMQWATLNEEKLKDNLKFLVKEVQKFEKRLNSLCEYKDEERCSFCSAPVPFENAEFAFCQGMETDNGVDQKHKLLRCAVSMLLCPINPSWFCISCQRRTTYLGPSNLFSMTKYPSDSSYLPGYSLSDCCTKPFCPFCGILLQRLQPEFLLSPSPI